MKAQLITLLVFFITFQSSYSVKAQQCEASGNCFKGECISREECAAKGNKYTWDDTTCPGEKCGCCKEVAPCEASATMCPKGICISREECANKGQGYIWNDDKCPGEKCGCCEKVSPCTPTSATCPNGKCISKEECEKEGTDFVWNERACPGDNCGCCRKVSPCIPTSEQCQNGKCISREECAKAGNEYTWNDDKCPGENCGCCESKPCFKDPQCYEFPNGKCVKNEEDCKAQGPSFTFSSKMCRRDGVEATCGCCYSNCFEKDEKCNTKGGKCVPNKDSCPTGDGFIFNPSYCQLNPNTGASTCGCCYPACRQKDPKCNEKGGKCVSKLELCPVNQGFIFDETLCRNDPITGEMKCGCCYPAPPPCKRFDPVCKEKGGKCVTKESECDVANGSKFEPSLCRTENAGPNAKCGCCIPPPKPCLETDPKCKEKKGKCLTSKQACLSQPIKGLIFDDSLCRTQVTGGECGCCYRTKPCKQSTLCSSKFGKCINKAVLSTACNSDANVIDDALCGGPTSNCSCCIPKGR